MGNQFQFSTLRRGQLMNALMSSGCKRSAWFTTQMEVLARQYHEWVQCNPKENSRLSVNSINEADRIANQAHFLCNDLEGVNAITYRRMDRECRKWNESFSFSQHKETVNDVGAFAHYARKRSCEKFRAREVAADAKLLCLVTGLIKLWTKGTRRALPDLPKWSFDRPQQTREFRRELERHPIWLILAELGMELTWFTLGEVINAALAGARRGEALESTENAVGQERGSGVC